MPTARQIFGGPGIPLRINPDTGLRVTTEDVVVDLGQALPELEAWAAENGHGIRSACDFEHAIIYRSAQTWTTTVLRALVGFIYDGSSQPTLLAVRLIAGAKEYRELAGLFHDLLYRLQAPRALADHVFWIISRSGEKQLGPVRAWMTWVGLRGFAWYAYWQNGRRLRAGQQAD